MKCATCQSELGHTDHICKFCGTPVPVNPALEDLYFSRLAANAPPSFVQKMRAAPYMAKERRTVTALMFSVANVDDFTKTIPEEERTRLLNQALDRFSKIIFEFEGTIAKLWENTVLAFFGAPVSHEDDPLRAVHSASAILEEIQDISKEIEASYGIPLKLHVVLNTGQIILGDVKSNLKFDFQSANETLECLDWAINADIPQCKALLFDDTYYFLKPFVRCTSMEEILCNDGKDAIHLWILDEITNQHRSSEKLTAFQQTPLIGRERELDLLLELSETVLAGLGRVGLILGDPGIGKSRLMLEWKRKIRSRYQSIPFRWIEARALSFGRELAFHLLKDLVRKALSLEESASDRRVKNTIEENLAVNAKPGAASTALYLMHLLDVPLSDDKEAHIHSLNTAELQAQYRNSIRILLQTLSNEQALIIILEDLQWADASSVDLLISLLSLTASCPILFCLVTREDRDSEGWRLVKEAREQNGPRMTALNLASLTEDESQSLIKKIINADEIPEFISTTVLGKSEGNPYFIEELMRMLINEGVLIKRSNRWIIDTKMDPQKIPDSLQGLITARIDRLPPGAKLTLRIASVIGRFFPEQVLEDVIAEVAPDISLMEELNTLESIGMVKVSQIKPELSYQFQHILLHEAAYHSIFETDRADLHLKVGKVLETRYPDQEKRLASQMAYHFLEGNQQEKAFYYLDLAGHVAMNAFANAEAENYFKQAVQLIKDPERLAHLYTDLGEALAQQAKHREAIQSWKNAIRYHQQLENADSLAMVYARAARSAWWAYDPKRSLEICLEGLQAVEGAVESPEIAYLVHETGRAYLFNNQPGKARSFSEQALEMAKHLDAFDVQAEALATIGILPNIKPEQAIAALEMAVKISESHNLYGPASRAYINLAAVIDNLGEVRLARDYRKRAIVLSNKAGGISEEQRINQSIAIASLWLADFDDAETLIKQMRQRSRGQDAYLDENTLNLIYLEGTLARLQGDFSYAIEIFTDLIDRSRQIDDRDRILQANHALAEVIVEPHQLQDKKGSRTDLDIALSMLSDTSQMDDKSNVIESVSHHCLISNIHALKGDFNKAKDALETANEIYKSQPIMQDRFRIIVAQARLEAAQSHFENALEKLAEAASMMEKMEGRWWRARIWLEIGLYHLNRNEPEDVDQAQNFFRESLQEFKEMGIEYYPDVIIDKLRQVKHVSRVQAIEHRKVTQEMAEAGRIQNTFIPIHSPKIPGYDISSILLPARETSGDFYDFIHLDDDKLAIVVADVGDKGAGAALYMAMSRTLIRTYAGEGKLEPAQVLNNVNRRILSDTQRGIFLTLVFGILDPKEGTFKYVNAGHNPPFLVKKELNEINMVSLEKTGTLVGLFENIRWEEKTLKIKPGEVLIFYTDGIPEAENTSGLFFGNERMQTIIKEGFSNEAQTYRNNILDKIKTFIGDAPRLDDITLIVVSKT
jgi:serine phosphatase RsbU (regulator of sigma subunit)